jgi:hypothetical protein
MQGLRHPPTGHHTEIPGDRRAPLGFWGMSDVEVRIATPEDASVVGRLLWEFNTECETPTPSAEGARHPVHPVAGSKRVVVLLAGREEPSGLRT